MIAEKDSYACGPYCYKRYQDLFTAARGSFVKYNRKNKNRAEKRQTGTAHHGDKLTL